MTMSTSTVKFRIPPGRNYLPLQDPKRHLAHFTNKIDEIVKQHTPLSASRTAGFPVWFTKSLINTFRKKQKSWVKWKKYGNLGDQTTSFKLVDSPFCQCSTSDCEYEQSAHHILWECSLWQNERNIMLDSVQVTSGVIYYTDLVETRTNFRAFKRFCHTYYWNQI